MPGFWGGCNHRMEMRAVHGLATQMKPHAPPSSSSSSSPPPPPPYPCPPPLPSLPPHPYHPHFVDVTCLRVFRYVYTPPVFLKYVVTPSSISLYFLDGAALIRAGFLVDLVVLFFHAAAQPCFDDMQDSWMG